MTRTVNAPTLHATTSAPERELRHGLGDGSLAEIEVAWSDPFGHAQGKRIPASQFLNRAVGAGFACCANRMLRHAARLSKMVWPPPPRANLVAPTAQATRNKGFEPLRLLVPGALPHIAVTHQSEVGPQSGVGSALGGTEAPAVR